MKIRAVAAVALLWISVSLVACGNDGGGAKAPIKIMTIASFESEAYSLPWLENAVRVAVDAINAEGGVDGRKIEAVFCNDKFDPNEATACAQRAVSEEVVAVIGGVTAYSGALAPVLEAANIPFIGAPGGDVVTEATKKAFYPINGSGVAPTYGIGSLAVSRGGPNVVMALSDNDAARTGGELIEEAVKTAGGTSSTVTAPMNAADYASTAASILSKNPDAVAMQGSGTDLVRIIFALRKTGYNGVIAAPASMATPDSIKALGPYAEGLVLSSRGVSALDTGNPTVAEFHKQMKADDPKVVIDDLGLNAWMSVHLFAEVIEGQDVSDGESVIDALNSISAPIDQGDVYPDYPGLQDSAPVPEFPQVAVFEAVATVIKDGKIVTDGEFFNPYSN